MTTDYRADYPFTTPATRVGVYAWVTSRSGVNHYRALEPLRVLAAHGNHVDYGRILSNQVLENVDTVLAHMLHGEQDLEAWEQLARNESHRLVIDLDDWMWAPDYGPFRAHYTPDVLARLFRAVSLAHVVTTPSPAIASYLHQYNENVWVVPNTVPEWVLTWTPPARTAPTVGFQMSDSHAPDWTASAVRGLLRFLNGHTDWYLHFYGQNPGALANRPGVLHTPWTNSIDTYYRQLSLDVGIGPLRDTPFNRAKSSLRAIEYMALGIVPVLPDLPIYRDWIDNGVNGRLIQTHETLAGVLAEVAPISTRLEMSRQARWKAGAWTTERNIERWLEAWHSR